MTDAFFGALVTQLSAQYAHCPGLPAAQAHELRGGITCSRAFHIQLDAYGHHFYILFLQTRGGTMITQCGAAKACFNTILVSVVVSHH
jgi:hypothetical protein